jgi:spermidine synthase
MLAWAGAAGPGRAQPPRYGAVARRESQYATTYVDWDGDYLTMRFGVNSCLFTETRYNPKDPAELPVVYTRYMTVALAYAAAASRIVEIGLGGGRLASYLHDNAPGARITCVELDPGVIDLAVSHFGVAPGPRLELVAGDGRVYMARARETFDVVLIDAYQGTLVPFHLVTREYYEILKARLAPGGVIAQNIAPKVLDAPRMVATARQVFAHVDFYKAGNNFVLIAYDGAAKSDADLLVRAREVEGARAFRYPLAAMIAERVADVVSDEKPFTDDFAPVGYSDFDRRCRAGAN